MGEPCGGGGPTPISEPVATPEIGLVSICRSVFGTYPDVGPPRPYCPVGTPISRLRKTRGLPVYPGDTSLVCDPVPTGPSVARPGGPRRHRRNRPQTPTLSVVGWLRYRGCIPGPGPVGLCKAQNSRRVPRQGRRVGSSAGRKEGGGHGSGTDRELVINDLLLDVRGGRGRGE